MSQPLEKKFNLDMETREKIHSLRSLKVTENDILIDSDTREPVIAGRVGRPQSFTAMHDARKSKDLLEGEIFKVALEVQKESSKTPNAYVLGKPISLYPLYGNDIYSIQFYKSK